MSGETSQVRELSDPKLEALVEMMFLAASADGEFSDVERNHFKASVESLTDGRVNGEKLETLLSQAQTDLDDAGREARLVSVKQRLPDAGSRKVALSLAIQVAAADGIIRTSERELIMEIADVLEIDPSEAADLVKKLSA